MREISGTSPAVFVVESTNELEAKFKKRGLSMNFFTSAVGSKVFKRNNFKYVAIAASSIGLAAYHIRKDAIALDIPNSTYQHVSKNRVPPTDGDGITKRLKEFERTVTVNKDGIFRYDFNQVASNDPCEDDHVEVIDRNIDEGNWYFWGIFDGHSGWNTSLFLRQHLVPAVVKELQKCTASYYHQNACPSSLALDKSISEAFAKVDHQIVHEHVSHVFNNPESLQVAASLLLPALSGSCALLTSYSAKSKSLQVACTGDSRAVLGECTPDGSWEAIPLSRDQTGMNPDEASRLEVEHPGEEVLRNNRILGRLMPSRAFGDARYKWSQEVSERLHREYFSASPIPVKTPPYVTAVPEIESITVNPKKHRFLIMASDGLWDTMSSEQAVQLVGEWADTVLGKTTNEKNTTQDEKQSWSLFKKTSKVIDDNAATHLIRHSLGGSDQRISALLTLTYPISRRYRDDITVTVIFFDEKTL